jgi:hypothetical protein
MGGTHLSGSSLTSRRPSATPMAAPRRHMQPSPVPPCLLPFPNGAVVHSLADPATFPLPKRLHPASHRTSPPPSMAPTEPPPLRASPLAPPPYKRLPLETRLSPHLFPSLPLVRSTAAPRNRAGAPPLAVDLLRRRLYLPSKASGEFLKFSSSFWCSSRAKWWPGGQLWLTIDEPPLGAGRPRHAAGPPPPVAARHLPPCDPDPKVRI